MSLWLVIVIITIITAATKHTFRPSLVFETDVVDSHHDWPNRQYNQHQQQDIRQVKSHLINAKSSSRRGTAIRVVLLPE